MKNMSTTILLVLLVLGGIVASEALYTVDETERVIITQFGKPVGEIINEAGLKVKVPFIQTVNRIEKRILVWDGSANSSRSTSSSKGLFELHHPECLLEAIA